MSRVKLAGIRLFGVRPDALLGQLGMEDDDSADHDPAPALPVVTRGAERPSA